MKILSILVVALLVWCDAALSTPQAASDPLYDEYEGAELAAALFRDGKLDAAKAAIESLSRGERREKAALVAKLNGELALAAGQSEGAIAHFLEALEAKGADPLRGELELDLARAYQRSNRPSECAKAAGRAGDFAYRQEADALTKASCERAAGDMVGAWKTLDRAINGRLGFSAAREKISLMLALGLREVAFRQVQSYILSEATISESLSLAEELLKAGAKEESLLALETAKLRFPDDQEILLAIAPLYFSRGLKRATAEAFALASIRNGIYSEHAAEILRQSGARQRSRYLNLYIPGERERGRQKLALAVESSRWDLVGSMDALVKRTALDEDDEVSYAVAFSLMRGRDLERSRSYLEKIRSPGFLAKVSALFKNIEECGKMGWRCL